MERLFRTHREAEARRDYDAIMDTFTPDCYLETIALGFRSEGREAARAAYVGYFTAFPDLTPDDQGGIGRPRAHQGPAAGAGLRRS